jgi:hypothetical protein
MDSAWPETRLLNHPLRVMQRYPLLRTLQQEGVNRFGVYRLEDERWPERYPVFVRRANGHSGPESGLIRDRAELDSVSRRLAGKIAADDLLITEFYAQPDSRGRFWKYSAFIFPDRIVPAHLFVAATWCVKTPEIVDDEIISAEYAYVRDNPHEQILRKAASIGNIDYGRIDYGLVDGQVQIYEINTHPQVMGRVDNFYDQRKRARKHSASLLEAAFLSIDTGKSRDRIRPPANPESHWWNDPGAGYIVLRKILKTVGRESAAPAVFHGYRRLKAFVPEKIRRALAWATGVRSGKAGRGSRR